MTTGMIHDQNLEKQMGCMAGFLQLFDRHQILTGKRLYTTKRLPPSLANDSTSQSEKSFGSPSFSRELQQQSPTPESMKPSPSPSPEISGRMPQPLPVLEFKDVLRSSWKLRESPRLSLDSRATVDAKGSLYPKEIRTTATVFSASRLEKNSETTNPSEENEKQKRSPSVIAKLMGLQALPDSGREPIKKAELRRSASESRVSRDLRYRFIDGNNFLLRDNPIESGNGTEDRRSKAMAPDLTAHCVRNPTSVPPKTSNGSLGASPWKSQQQQCKSFFDSGDFFPEPKQTESLYGEIEKRLKMRGIDEPAKDLETLKQILEALQLKGLLHSKRPSEQSGNRNFVFDRRFSYEESPIVVMKPSKSPISINRNGRKGSECPSNFRSKAGISDGKHNLSGENSSPVKQRSDRREIDRNLQRERRISNSRSPDRIDSAERSPRSLVRRKPLNIEIQRRENDSLEQRRSSPIHSPKINSKKAVSDQKTNRSIRNVKPTAEISPTGRFFGSVEDESSIISESSSLSTSSQFDTERSKGEDYKETGRSLLERCDKLLHSIAEFTTTTSTESQPSPVSVLESSFSKDESSPSPVRKRCIDFKDQVVELECDNWSPVKSPDRLNFQDNPDDYDFQYITEILRASNCLSEDTDVFLLLEKQQFKTNSSKVSRLHRKLVFDTITEILDRKKQIPNWKTFSGSNSVIGKPSLRQIWSEFQKIQEREDPAEDLFQVICGVLRKDMAGDSMNGWVELRLETSDAVLDIERLIFKDLIGETIRDLAAFTGNIKALAPKRKLVF